MAAPLDAIESTSAAWNRAVELMFKPFRWSIWWRMAFLAFITGELSSGGNFNVPGNLGDLGNRSGHKLLATPMPWEAWGAGVIAALVVTVLVVGIVFMYLGCVFRFVLFDAVLTGRYRLREGFARWQHHGTRFFWWSLGYALVLLAGVGLGVLIIVMGVRGMKAGAGSSILGIVFAVMMILALLVVGATVFVLTKDFAIPIMAFEGRSTNEAWGRLWPMMKAKPVDYLGYVGMKIVLTIGAGIISGIISLALVVILVIVGVIVVAVAVGLHLTWNAATIALAVVGGLVALLLMFFLMGMIGAPFAAFFQAYAIYFFGRRFRPMEMVMYPEPPAPPSAPEAPPSPEPPPAPPAIVPA